MINEKERKTIQRYCLFPQLAWAFMLMAFLIGGVFILLVMINDLAFDGGFYEPGLYLYLGIVILYLIFYMICILTTRIGMQRKKWQGIVKKANVCVQEKDRTGQLSAALGTKAAGSLMSRSDNSTIKAAGNAANVASAVESTAIVADMASEMTRNAKITATALDVKIPKAGKYIAAIVILPIIVMVAAYMPHYISTKNIKDTKIAVATESVYAVQSALGEGCEYVSKEDPSKYYSSYGYTITGGLYGTSALYDSSVNVKIDNDGYITRVNYSIDINISEDKIDNLASAEADIIELNRLLNESGVESISDELLSFCEIPEEFITKFQEASYYENVYWYSENGDISIGYYTDDEENYDEDSRSYIYLSIDPR